MIRITMSTRDIAMDIVQQLYDLAEIPLKKQELINDEADALAERLLEQYYVSGSKEDKGAAAIELLKQIDAWLSFNAEPDGQQLMDMRSSIQKLISGI